MFGLFHPRTEVEILSKLFKKPKIHNVEFIFREEEKIIKAHKCFLVEASEVWEKMFCDEGLRESKELVTKIYIEDTNYIMFKAFLQFCYFGKITFTLENALPILLIAEKYMQKRVIKLAIDYILAQHEDFLLQSLGKMMHLGIDLESISYLKDKISDLLDRHPHIYLSLPNVFNNLSSSIKDTIFRLFSRKVMLPPSTKLKRMIEYGKSLCSQSEYSTTLKDQLEPVLKYINPRKLSAIGLQLIKDNSLYPLEEITNHCIQIINETQSYHPDPTNLLKIDLKNNTSISGSMLESNNVFGSGNINTFSNGRGGFSSETVPNRISIDNIFSIMKVEREEGKTNLNMTNRNLRISFNKEYIIYKFELSIDINHEGFSFELLYSDDGLNWKIDSLHFPSLETKMLPKIPADSFHTFRTISRRKHKYWQMKGRSGPLGFSGGGGALSIYALKL